MLRAMSNTEAFRILSFFSRLLKKEGKAQGYGTRTAEYLGVFADHCRPFGPMFLFS